MWWQVGFGSRFSIQTFMILSRFIAAICKILIRLKHFRVSGPVAFFPYPLFLFPPNLESLHCAGCLCTLTCPWMSHKLSAQKHRTTTRRRSWSKVVMGMFCWTTQLGPLLGGGRWLLVFLTLLIPNENFLLLWFKGEATALRVS